MLVSLFKRSVDGMTPRVVEPNKILYAFSSPFWPSDNTKNRNFVVNKCNSGVSYLDFYLCKR